MLFVRMFVTVLLSSYAALSKTTSKVVRVLYAEEQSVSRVS
jgi:hypothetical protein